MTYPQTPAQLPTPSGWHGWRDPAQPAHTWCLAATVALSGFLVTMNHMAVQVALPQMMTTLGLDLDHAQWVLIAYTIASALVVPTVGWLGQHLGHRRPYFLSLLIFVTTAILCACAWSGPVLIAWRLVQGLGGGAITPMTMTVLSGVFPPTQRGRAMGIFGMTQTAGPVLGAVLGGVLTSALGWRAVVLSPTLPGLLCLALVWCVMPHHREEDPVTFDALGLLSLATMLVSLLVALSQGQRVGWDAPWIHRLLAVAGVAGVVFLARELSSPHPLIDLRLYANGTFAAASGIMLLFFMAFTGSTFLQVLLIQRLLGYTPAQAGLVLLPGALALSLSFPLAGLLTDRYPRRRLMLGALSLTTLASYLFTFVTLERSLSWLIGLVLLRYSCGSFVYVPLLASALTHLPPDKVRLGSGLLNLMQQGLGNTLGLALMTTVWQDRLVAHSHLLAPPQAAMAAYQECFLLVTVLGLASLPLVGLIRQPQP